MKNEKISTQTIPGADFYNVRKRSNKVRFSISTPLYNDSLNGVDSVFLSPAKQYLHCTTQCKVQSVAEHFANNIPIISVANASAFHGNIVTSAFLA